MRQAGQAWLNCGSSRFWEVVRQRDCSKRPHLPRLQLSSQREQDVHASALAERWAFLRGLSRVHLWLDTAVGGHSCALEALSLHRDLQEEVAHASSASSACLSGQQGCRSLWLWHACAAACLGLTAMCWFIWLAGLKELHIGQLLLSSSLLCDCTCCADKKGKHVSCSSWQVASQGGAQNAAKADWMAGGVQQPEAHHAYADSPSGRQHTRHCLWCAIPADPVQPWLRAASSWCGQQYDLI